MSKPTWLRCWTLGLCTVALAFAFTAVGLPGAQAQEKKPNILVIFGDDIGQANISAYTKRE